MMRSRLNRFLATATLAGLAALALPTVASAQFAGDNLKGDNGLNSGTQPPPGLYLLAAYLHYDADSLLGSNGNKIALDPQQRSSIAANGIFVPNLLYVSKAKVLGADYGFLLAPGFLNKRTEAPIIALDDQSNTKFTDLYIQPVRLGWHAKRADFLAGLGLFAPTGDYTFRGDHNSGLGMWGYELFAGTTLYLDGKKHWNLATTAFYETHSHKKDTEVKVGDVLTLEGGLGRSFLGGGANLGVAYYAQWKVTADDFSIAVPAIFPGADVFGKNRVFAAGPEFTMPIATKAKLYAFANVRYLWEFGARTTLQGQTLFVTLTVPVPSIPLK